MNKVPEKYIPSMTLENLQDFAIVNIDKYRKFMLKRRLKRKKR